MYRHGTFLLSYDCCDVGIYLYHGEETQEHQSAKCLDAARDHVTNGAHHVLIEFAPQRDSLIRSVLCFNPFRCIYKMYKSW